MRRFRGDDHAAKGFPERELFGHLTAARRSLALFQHHDGITGTARDPVVVDYGTRWVSTRAARRRLSHLWRWFPAATVIFFHLFFHLFSFIFCALVKGQHLPPS